jgi:PAS domain S-box-containing protein
MKQPIGIPGVSEFMAGRILQCSPVPTFVIDTAHRVLHWNEALSKLSGIPANKMIGTKDQWKAFYPEQRPCLADLVAEDRANEIETWYKGKYRRSPLVQNAYEALDFIPNAGKSGLFLRFTSAAIRDLEGKILGAVEMLEDITDRVRTEEAYRETQAQLNNVIDFLPDATIVIDRNGKVVAWNQAIEKLTGVKARDILGKGDFEYSIPFYGERRPILVDLALRPHEEVEKRYAAIHRQGDTIVGEAYMTGMENGKVVLWGTAGVLRDSSGQIIGAIESIRDITERKSMERKIENELVKFKGLYDLALNLSAEKSLEDNLAFIVEQSRKILCTDTALISFADETCQELVIHTLSGIQTDAFKKMHVPFGNGLGGLVMATRKGTIVEDYFADPEIHHGVDPLMRAEGLVCGMGVPIQAGTQCLGVLTVFNRAKTRFTQEDLDALSLLGNLAAVEITRVRAEEERRKLETQFQHTQKLESLGVLAGGIAHDFNNLLATILGNLDVALIDLPAESACRESLIEAQQASRRAAELIRQMLAYSGRGRFVIQAIDLGRTLKELTHIIQVSISKKAKLKFNLEENLPTIEADAAQLRQVAMNLIINASESFGELDGMITISTGLRECDRAFLSSTWLDDNLPGGRYVFLEVSDTGSGMDDATRLKIFEPFFTTKFAGRGLGLAAVLGIVRVHRGAIQVRSTPGKGSTFSVFFPVPQKPAAPMPLLLHDNDNWRGSGTILVVDDEMPIRDMVKRMLTRMGFSVLLASDGREAIKIFSKNMKEIDCIFLDLTMPVMDGEETLRELRKQKKDITVILSSGHSEQEIAPKFAGKGLAGFIQKPYEYGLIAMKLKEILGN